MHISVYTSVDFFGSMWPRNEMMIVGLNVEQWMYLYSWKRNYDSRTECWATAGCICTLWKLEIENIAPKERTFCVRTALCQNRFVSEPFCVRTVLCQNCFVSEPFWVRTVLCQNHFVSEPFCARMWKSVNIVKLKKNTKRFWHKQFWHKTTLTQNNSDTKQYILTQNDSDTFWAWNNVKFTILCHFWILTHNDSDTMMLLSSSYKVLQNTTIRSIMRVLLFIQDVALPKKLSEEMLS